MTGADDETARLRGEVRDILDGNLYLTLGTSEPDGTPRVSPVYFTHHGYRHIYWVSGPDARHSRNVARRPAVALVVYDSTLPPNAGRAVYLTGHAAEVPAEDLAAETAVAFARTRARAFTPAELTGTADLRLYRADIHRHELHVRGSDPRHGRGIDTRLAVEMPSAGGAEEPPTVSTED